MKYKTIYGQHGEDPVILEIFEQLGIEKPSYLDLGANHPYYISNTKLLYDRGSRGVNVDANPYVIEEFDKIRFDDVNILCGVGPKEGIYTFYVFDKYSGLNTFSHEEASAFSESSGSSIAETWTRNIDTLNNIINKHMGGQFPQFLNCDIEGFDYDVLSTADFSKSSPIVVCVETRKHASKKMTDMMVRQGFVPHCRMGENIIYVQRSYMIALMKEMGL